MVCAREMKIFLHLPHFSVDRVRTMGGGNTTNTKQKILADKVRNGLDGEKGPVIQKNVAEDVALLPKPAMQEIRMGIARKAKPNKQSNKESNTMQNRRNSNVPTPEVCGLNQMHTMPIVVFHVINDIKT